MSVPLEARASTHPGLHHSLNEDSHALFDAEDGGRVLLVCDGMGGMGRGDEASSLAVAVIRQSLQAAPGFPADRMRQALRVADDRLRDELCRPGQGQPGSTAVLAWVSDGAAHVAWVGDSRAYLVRHGRVVDRTRDHKLVDELVEAGQLTAEQARHSTLAHVVTRALGGRSVADPTVRPAVLGHPWKLLHGDRIVLCSDGLCDLVEDDELGALVDDGTEDQVTARLVQVALDRGGHDNITVIVATWVGPDWVEDDASTPVMSGERYLPEEDLRLLEDDSQSGSSFGGERVTEELEPEAVANALPPGLRRPVGAPAVPVEGAEVRVATPAPETERRHVPSPAGAPPADPALEPPPTPAVGGMGLAVGVAALLAVVALGAWWFLGL